MPCCFLSITAVLKRFNGLCVVCSIPLFDLIYSLLLLLTATGLVVTMFCRFLKGQIVCDTQNYTGYDHKLDVMY